MKYVIETGKRKKILSCKYFYTIREIEDIENCYIEEMEVTPVSDGFLYGAMKDGVKIGVYKDIHEIPSGEGIQVYDLMSGNRCEILIDVPYDVDQNFITAYGDDTVYTIARTVANGIGDWGCLQVEHGDWGCLQVGHNAYIGGKYTKEVHEKDAQSCPCRGDFVLDLGEY